MRVLKESTLQAVVACDFLHQRGLHGNVMTREKKIENSLKPLKHAHYFNLDSLFTVV